MIGTDSMEPRLNNSIIWMLILFTFMYNRYESIKHLNRWNFHTILELGVGGGCNELRGYSSVTTYFSWFFYANILCVSHALIWYTINKMSTNCLIKVFRQKKYKLWKIVAERLNKKNRAAGSTTTFLLRIFCSFIIFCISFSM